MALVTLAVVTIVLCWVGRTMIVKWADSFVSKIGVSTLAPLASRTARRSKLSGDDEVGQG